MGKQSKQQTGLAQKPQLNPKHEGFAVPGFEPGLPDSESGVLTTTLYRKFKLENEHFSNTSKQWKCRQGTHKMEVGEDALAHHLWR